MRTALLVFGLMACGGTSGDSGPTCPGYTLGTTSIPMSNVPEMDRLLIEMSRLVGDLHALDARLTNDVLVACRNIGTDIGAAKPATDTAIEWCRASTKQLAAMGLSFSYSPIPSCTPSMVEVDACSARCSTTSCAPICSAMGRARATCDDPKLVVKVQGSNPNIAVVQKTLEVNLPLVARAVANTAAWETLQQAFASPPSPSDSDALGKACVARISDDLAKVIAPEFLPAATALLSAASR